MCLSQILYELQQSPGESTTVPGAIHDQAVFIQTLVRRTRDAPQRLPAAAYAARAAVALAAYDGPQAGEARDVVLKVRQEGGITRSLSRTCRMSVSAKLCLPVGRDPLYRSQR